MKAVVVYGFGINCDFETTYSINKVGGKAERIHLNELIWRPEKLFDYSLLVIPGGFSFGDHLGSGRIFGNKLRYKLGKQLERFIEDGNGVLGICNGFQVLVKVGLLPYTDFIQRTTLTFNSSGKFEDRWVYLKFNESPCVFTKGIERLYLPVRHGEGRFLCDENLLEEMEKKKLIVTQYTDEQGRLAPYPYCPNGAVKNIAGICDPSGRVFGMMPHPECFNDRLNSPLWGTEMERKWTELGMKIFKNAVDYWGRG